MCIFLKPAVVAAWKVFPGDFLWFHAQVVKSRGRPNRWARGPVQPPFQPRITYTVSGSIGKNNILGIIFYFYLISKKNFRVISKPFFVFNPDLGPGIACCKLLGFGSFGCEILAGCGLAARCVTPVEFSLLVINVYQLILIQDLKAHIFTVDWSKS